MNKKIFQTLLDNNYSYITVFGTSLLVIFTTDFESALWMVIIISIMILLSSILVFLLSKIVSKKWLVFFILIINGAIISLMEIFLKSYLYNVIRSIGLNLPILVANGLVMIYNYQFVYKEKIKTIMIGNIIIIGLLFIIVCLLTLSRYVLSLIIPAVNSTIGGMILVGLILGIFQSLKIWIIENKKKGKVINNE